MIEEPKNLHGLIISPSSIIVGMFSTWSEFFKTIEGKPYFLSLQSFWDEVYQKETVYPPRNLVSNAFRMCPLNKTKVVLLGQDPYHEPGQAMGLSFSVPRGVMLPPSLKNIYKEIENDLGIYMNNNDGDLTYLAKQGVLLLNVNLTVRAHEALSHQKQEYLDLTHDVLSCLNEDDRPMVFLLLGGFAKSFRPLLTNPKHLILTAAHTSPLSANRGGFFNTHLFSRCNEYLSQNGLEPIRWGNALF